MSEISDLLLTGLLNHGNVLLASTLFFAALGIPLPATMLLVAAGAFTSQGVLELESAVLAALTGSVAGDGGSYLIGRFGITLMPARLQASGSWLRAARLFGRWGGWSVFISRFLLTPVALPVNLLAGSTRYSGLRYMTAVLLGEMTWVALFGGLGLVFADRWEGISQLAGDLVGLLLGVVLMAAGLWVFVARRRPHGSPTQP